MGHEHQDEQLVEPGGHKTQMGHVCRRGAEIQLIYLQNNHYCVVWCHCVHHTKHRPESKK